MTFLQPITYRGRLVAVAGTRRFFLAAHLDDRPTGDPDVAMVIYMCAYARDIATGRLPGPYRDQDARRYARGCLLAPGLAELLERENLNVSRAGHALGIPTDELQTEIIEHRPGSAREPTEHRDRTSNERRTRTSQDRWPGKQGLRLLGRHSGGVPGHGCQATGGTIRVAK